MPGIFLSFDAFLVKTLEKMTEFGTKKIISKYKACSFQNALWIFHSYFLSICYSTFLDRRFCSLVFL